MRLLNWLLAALLLAPSAVVAPVWADTVPAPARDGAWPLTPRPQVVHGFDPPATRWGAGHRGVDLLGHVGQSVHSALGGTVSFAAPLAGRGVVVVDHGGVRTTYEPVSASVAVGDVVGRGEVIGSLQRSSSHCLPRACLHWGLLRAHSYLNPLTLVGAGPIRLLPLSGPLTGTGSSMGAWGGSPVAPSVGWWAGSGTDSGSVRPMNRRGVSGPVSRAV